MKNNCSLFLTAVGFIILISLWSGFVITLGTAVHERLDLPEEDTIAVVSLLLGIFATLAAVALLRRFNLSSAPAAMLLYLLLFFALGGGIISVVSRWPLILLALLLFCAVAILRFRINYRTHMNRKGYWVGHEGRDEIYYEEKYRDAVRRMIIPGEMLVGGPIHRVIYVPNDAEWREKMPEWARGRKAEIMDRIKTFLGQEHYEYDEQEL